MDVADLEGISELEAHGLWRVECNPLGVLVLYTPGEEHSKGEFSAVRASLRSLVVSQPSAPPAPSDIATHLETPFSCK